MISAEAKINEVKYECCPEKYQDMTFTFVQKRYSYTPVLTLLVPCLLIAMLIELTFFLPPDAGEKIGLSKFLVRGQTNQLITLLDITIMLAMIVFMDQLSGEMPPMADSLPVIGTVRTRN